MGLSANRSLRVNSSDTNVERLLMLMKAVRKFEAANGGSLFMDEIGNLPLALQAKLLTVLQNRNITRIGSNKVIPVDIRLISATNKDIPEMIKEGLFREDLFYRINTIHLEIPL